MPSFYDLIKYAATGKASSDMTGYDKMKALSMFGGFPISTITGIPPISFKSDGTPLTALSISGNMQQTGTPTPDAPIIPQEVGDKTANLFDKDNANILNAYINPTSMMIKLSANVRSFWIACDANASYSISRIAGKRFAAAWSEAEPALDVSVYGIVTDNEATSLSITTGSTAKYLVIFYYNSNYDTLTEQQIRDSIMLNTGSTALDYEPYGYKIPLTCAGQTVPVYLGQTQTVRRIKKLVLTGDDSEGWRLSGGNLYASVTDADSKPSSICVCTHFASSPTSGLYVSIGLNRLKLFSQSFPDGVTSATTFQQWLAAQYANSTPVCVWYVLANEQTGIVNEPLAKIGYYADELNSTDAAVTIPAAKGQNTLSIGTTLQPSEVSITGHIKEVTT